MHVDLNILEIEILLYLLNGRTALGPHAESAKKKLNAARRAILEVKTTDESAVLPLFGEGI